MNCHREEQMRWFHDAWKDCKELKNEGVDIRAITAWSLFGSFGWDKLLTGNQFKYETGIFDITSGKPRETSLAGLIRNLSTHKTYTHPVLNKPGWWKRNTRFSEYSCELPEFPGSEDIVFIIGKTGSLGKVFTKHCNERAIANLCLGKNEFDICNSDQMNYMIKLYKPWAIINCAGYVNIDAAETDIIACLEINTKGVINLSKVCSEHNIKLMSFSSDMVFNGNKQSEYTEEDTPDPINIYGISKYLTEHFVLKIKPDALMIRTSSFFSPYDDYNFLSIAFREISEGRKFIAANDVTMSATYIPHLVNKSLDLMLDDEKGILHLTNSGAINWAQFALISAEQACLDTEFIEGKNLCSLNLKARRPENSSLISTRGVFLPTIHEGIQDFVNEYKQKNVTNSEHILIK
jgi:dTDP-4-dehydrorhamnose reductase